MSWIAVDWDGAGWPEVGDRTKLCCTQNVAPCDDLAVWKVERSGRGYCQAGYYCPKHLPDDAADALDPEEGEESTMKKKWDRAELAQRAEQIAAAAPPLTEDQKWELRFGSAFKAFRDALEAEQETREAKG